MMLTGWSFVPLATIWVPQSTLVQTKVETIIGRVENVLFNGTVFNIKEFLGIPYAKTPVGELRFEKPERRPPFSTLSPDVQSEDCLRLNIFIPSEDTDARTKRAVLIWVHGGIYEVGTQNWYLAKMLAASQDIIFVTLNFRLSVLGFLSTGGPTSPGNNGLWDQRLAIEWVYDNIDSFGGDIERISIAGESAGSASLIHQALYKYPDSDHQQSVIAQSGSANSEFMLEANPLNKFIEFTTKVPVRESLKNNCMCEG